MALSRGNKFDVALERFALSLLHFFVERNFNKAGGASLSVRTYILPVAVIAYYMILVIGSIMFVPHPPQPALHTCGWARGPGALTGPHAREREREREDEYVLFGVRRGGRS